MTPLASWLLIIIAGTSTLTAFVVLDAWLWKRRERQLEARRRALRNIERHYPRSNYDR